MLLLFVTESGAGKDELKQISLKLNKRRTTILDQLKKGELLVDSEWLNITDAVKNIDSQLYQYIHHIFMDYS